MDLRLANRKVFESLVKAGAFDSFGVHRAALWAALGDGTLDLVATDHAPHTLAEKARPYPEAPSGMPGLENSLVLMLTRAAEGDVSSAGIASVLKAKAATMELAPEGRTSIETL